MFKKTLTIVALLASASLVSAATTVTNTFSSGQTIVASEMNTNFTDLTTAIDALETRIAALEAAASATSPDADLTGKTYCIRNYIGGVGAADDGSWLGANSSSEYLKMEFTSTTEGTFTIISSSGYEVVTSGLDADLITEPAGSEAVTYTVVGNVLTVTFGGTDDLPFTISADGKSFIGSFTEGPDRSIDNTGNWYDASLVIGVLAASCL